MLRLALRRTACRMWIPREFVSAQVVSVQATVAPTSKRLCILRSWWTGIRESGLSILEDQSEWDEDRVNYKLRAKGIVISLALSALQGGHIYCARLAFTFSISTAPRRELCMLTLA